MFSLQRFGGISRIFIELMRELSKKPDCGIHWFRGCHVDEYKIKDFCPRLQRYQGFQEPALFRRFVGKHRQKLNGSIFSLFTRQFAGGYDIYHPTYYDDSLLGSARAKRMAVTICDMIPEKFLFSTSSGKKLIETKRNIIHRADLIFVISASTRNDLVELLGVTESKIRVISLGSRMDEVKAVTLDPRLFQKPFFLYVGTRSKYKNFEILMRAFALSERLKSDFQVVCFGGSAPFLSPELVFMKENGILDNFIYLNGSDALLKGLYGKAKALVYTSRYEGFGLPLLEAMECGCPVVCCRVSSIPEVTGPAALFFDPDSPEELASCMQKIVQDSSLRNTMIGQGLDRAKEFSWEKTASAVWNGYQELAGLSYEIARG